MKSRLLLMLLFVTTTLFAQNDLKSNFERHVSTLASVEFEGRAPHTKGDTLAVNYIVDQFKMIPNVELMGDNGLQIVRDSARRRTPIGNNKKLKEGEKPKFKIDTFLLETFNVVARVKALPENNPTGEAIVIGAHYDHFGYKQTKSGKIALFPGADDNASGTAFVIEYAREIAKLQDILERDVIFVLFGAEELGLCGSRFYAKNPLYPNEKCVAMFNFDMVGHMVKNGITIRGLGSAVEAPSLFSTLPNKDKLEIIWEFKTKGPTDYTAFYNVGISAFSFSTRLHDDYHTERDTMDLINLDGMVMLFDYVQNIIRRLAIEATPLTYISE